MKRRILITATLLLVLTLTACGESRPYTWAIIKLDGETIAEGHIDSKYYCHEFYMDIEIDGKRYRASYDNIILMEAPPTTDTGEELRPC